jgi:thioredoxin-related protein
MKNLIRLIFTISLLSIICIPAFSQTSNKNNEKGIYTESKIHWYTFEEATKLNSKHPKKIFLDMYTDWCGWCKRLDAVTFVHPEIVKYVNKNFYAVKFNAERKDVISYKGKNYTNTNPNQFQHPHDLAALFLQNKFSYPTMVFLDEKMNEIAPVPGYMKPKEFERLINFIGSDAFQKQTFESYGSTFQGKVTE